MTMTDSTPAVTRQEHLARCKQRALEYVARGDYPGAVTSMLSDLGKHPETERSSTGICAQIGMMELVRPTRDSITRYIEGFN
jgi:hypothetical protein